MRSVDLIKHTLFRCSIWQAGKILPAANLKFSTHAKRQALFSIYNSGYNAPRTDSMPVSPCQHNKHYLYLVSHRTMAGHSHWANIRHTKGAADAKHAANVQMFVKLMKGAISDGGSNPETNSKLASILERMKSVNIAKADIKRYLENATKKAGSSQTFYFEVRGPRGAIFVLEVESENFKLSRDLLNASMKKTNGKVQDIPSFQSFFDMKGIVSVPVTKDMQVSNMDEYLEIAIETGAEDVILTKDENGDGDEYTLKFHCDPQTMKKTAKDIEETYNLEYSTCEVELFPHNWVTIDSKDDIEACTKIADKLQNHPEFVNLFDNISMPDD
ncbi:probable transcriptional regulatory protein TTE1135 [Mercenaria mercenaria]|uniref:probable transcriptional regulatory protein TTE1135 n=1 Tax=Mercenaria mercenaria TaxID=6596 RepID=UPI00234E56E3|nr:probable transcriptional regulatory protein TTE1135 [Mercenaria mercenaria]XP_053374549.1 probable transcriptional regulatory protein TTE1135 [Mercenaria mercenaria]